MSARALKKYTKIFTFIGKTGDKLEFWETE